MDNVSKHIIEDKSVCKKNNNNKMWCQYYVSYSYKN